MQVILSASDELWRELADSIKLYYVIIGFYFNVHLMREEFRSPTTADVLAQPCCWNFGDCHIAAFRGQTPRCQQGPLCNIRAQRSRLGVRSRMLLRWPSLNPSVPPARGMTSNVVYSFFSRLNGMKFTSPYLIYTSEIIRNVHLFEVETLF